ncbi:MAG: 23S rRNA (pseudouridine(1915)-N(3))-methyltransferase RlmH [Bacteroidales bacterium]|jgi:23S rRNA (pseudouridine1915-N3)-methyltransferase|nr:23S rRNA (pseudouridine(1915)-N(3))-methyltransferase RlmH [Bacteroidales bacterium]
MKIILIQAGKTADKNVSEIAELYSARIAKYNSIEIITLPNLRNTKNMPEDEQKIKEGKLMLRAINDDDFVVVMDERGQEMRTVELAGWLKKTFMLPAKRLIFVIGGAWGFSGEVYTRADYRISLSKLTFPHQLVRLIFLEQLYRAFTILKGEPYHHE